MNDMEPVRGKHYTATPKTPEDRRAAELAVKLADHMAPQIQAATAETLAFPAIFGRAPTQQEIEAIVRRHTDRAF